MCLGAASDQASEVRYSRPLHSPARHGIHIVFSTIAMVFLLHVCTASLKQVPAANMYCMQRSITTCTDLALTSSAASSAHPQG